VPLPSFDQDVFKQYELKVNSELVAITDALFDAIDLLNTKEEEQFISFHRSRIDHKRSFSELGKKRI